MYFKSEPKERSGSALCSPTCATSFSLHVLFLDYVTFLRWPAVRREPWSCELLYWIILRRVRYVQDALKEETRRSRHIYGSRRMVLRLDFDGLYADAEWSTVEVKSSREADKWHKLYSQLVINRGRAEGFSWQDFRLQKTFNSENNWS